MTNFFREWPQDHYNQKWIDNVKPSDWVNPTPEGRYNMVVIGAGTAGLVTAAACAGLGGKVALIEKHMLGGDCLNIGCVPSKAILRAAHAVQDIEAAQHLGVNVNSDSVSIDFGAVMERVRKVRSDISPHDSVKRFSDLGVDVFLGEAAFSGPDTISVGDTKLQFNKAVIASGARAFVPPIPGIEETGYLTNETVFNLTERPERMLVVGGGPIGCELAQAFHALGSKVTLVEAASHLLGREDQDAAAILKMTFETSGMDVRFETKFTKAWVDNGRKLIELERDGQNETIEVDVILLSVGRRPNVEGLNLETVGVDYDNRGVKVDKTLRTANPKIYACGDVCLPYQFTHTADFAARIVIRNGLFSFLPTKQKWTDLVIPWCTYTRPEIAHVGMGEEEAKEKGILYDVYQKPFSDVDRAMADEETDGFVKIITEKGSDKILGSIIVANHAGDMINEITLAMKNKIGLGSIASVIHPYPTKAEAIRQCGDLYTKTKLTPAKKNILTTIWRWMR